MSPVRDRVNSDTEATPENPLDALAADGEPEPADLPESGEWSFRRAIRELAYRTAELLETYNHRVPDVDPDGQWILIRNNPTRKVWEGYGRHVTVRTTGFPGGGWWAYQSDPGTSRSVPLFPTCGEYTVDNHGLRPGPEDAGADRARVFDAVEQYMTEVAHADAEREDRTLRQPTDTKSGEGDGENI